ncbi:hypothetical protein F5884DRAFT_659397 [Xylogone sp. PMI_703]|nr:hypothetical protein F5884DRAFT_659397 [Xylogone sp. PMI_703]
MWNLQVYHLSPRFFCSCLLHVWDITRTCVLVEEESAYVENGGADVQLIRIRRIKCDEGKPICERCRKAGIKCDGYKPVETQSSNAVRQSRSRTRTSRSLFGFGAMRTNKRDPPSLEFTPSASLFATEEEFRYFTLFRDKTSHDIVPYFASDGWRRLIIQACSNSAAIRQAVIAIGALDKTSMTANDTRSLSFDHRLPINDPSVHHRASIEHYSLAIRTMREAVSRGEQDLRTTLVSCLVINCFEAFHGNHELADAQIQRGNALIQAWKKEYPDHADKFGLGFTSPAPDIVEDEIVQLFGRLEIQTNSFIDNGSLEHHEELRKEGIENVRSMPTAFENHEQARIYLELVMRRLEHFMHVSGATFSQAMQARDPGVERSPLAAMLARLASIKAVHVGELLRWKAAFQTFLSKCPKRQRNVLGELLMRLHFTSSYVALMTNPGPDNSDSFVKHMAEVVKLPSGPRSAKFTLDIGVIVPLYLVALKCRVSTVRRKAIALLLEWPRREGVWDSLFAGRIAEWVMNIEEEFLSPEGVVPPWARVQRVTSKFDLLQRKAELVCMQRVPVGSQDGDKVKGKGKAAMGMGRGRGRGKGDSSMGGPPGGPGGPPGPLEMRERKATVYW